MDFLNTYNHKKNIRFESFEYALKEANKRQLKIFVETGISRGKKKFLFFVKKNWKDGMSTLIFSNYAYIVSGHLYACDISQKNIDSAKKFTKKFSKFVTFFNENSLTFLENFQKKIDFLYLDSMDGHLPGAAKHQLQEINCAENKLHSNSLVLLDDKDVKSALAIDYMLKNNFKILKETNEQILFSC